MRIADPGSGISLTQDPRWKNFGFRIRDKHPWIRNNAYTVFCEHGPDCFLDEIWCIVAHGSRRGRLSICKNKFSYLMWGLRNRPKIWVYDIMTMGLVYPLSEHVDIFPVRLVSTFPLSILRLPYSNHLSYIVVFILAGGIKDKGWILFY
jgi:hypothetical protein